MSGTLMCFLGGDEDSEAIPFPFSALENLRAIVVEQESGLSVEVVLSRSRKF